MDYVSEINPNYLYINCGTGEVTSDRNLARSWIKNGDSNVELYRNGHKSIVFNSLGLCFN